MVRIDAVPQMPVLSPPAALFGPPPAPAPALTALPPDVPTALALPVGSALPVLALEPAPSGGALAQRIARSAAAIASARDTTGSCYEAVAEAIEAHLPPFLWGMSAWMAADQLAASAQFRELEPGFDPVALPAGTVVVWAKGSSPHGHISVALGDGREASDHIAPQMPDHYGGGRPRAFVPLG